MSHDDHHSVACRMAFCGRLFIADNWLDTCKKTKDISKKTLKYTDGKLSVLHNRGFHSLINYNMTLEFEASPRCESMP